jgi:hypothetical protein
MDTRQVTEIIIVATLVIWIVWDIFVASNKTKGDTESEIVRDYTIYPVVPASLAAVLGHWTILGHRIIESAAHGLFITLGLLAIVAVWSVLVKLGKLRGFALEAHSYVARRPWIPAIIFYAIGGFLWGQAPAQI